MKSMETSLDCKIANEIKDFISDSSCYQCKDSEILKVEQIQIFLPKDFASKIPEHVNFNASARFTFKKGNTDGDLLSPSPIDFDGLADIDIKELKVIKVYKPIFLHKSV